MPLVRLTSYIYRQARARSAPFKLDEQTTHVSESRSITVYKGQRSAGRAIMENLNPRSDLLSILGHALVLVGFSFLLGMNIALWGDEQPEDGDEVGSTR